MGAFDYLLLVNIYLVLFYGFYSIFLKDETFFKLNRIYLVGGASISFLIPFLQSDWIRSLFITKQVEEVTQTFSMNLSGEAVIMPARNQGLETGEILLLIYFAGVVICLLRFLWQLYKLKSILNSHENGQAFSFFSKVKVGSDILNRDTIYGHELVHAGHWHSADVILFEIICIISWFNPVVYFYRKAIKHIHEFTADEIASRQEESRSAYAIVLLSQTFRIPTHQLTNSFYNQSLLKRRIIMLHKSKSTRNALLKYGLSAPLFAAMMVLSSASFKPERVAEKITEVSSEAIGLAQAVDTTESDYQQFLKRNPSVKALEWKTFTYVTVILKSGKRENYSLNRPEELKKAEGLYGSFPQAPPPPPPTPMVNTPQVSLNKDKGPLFTEVEVSPTYPGGMQAFYKYFAANFKYPSSAIQEKVSGKLILQFVVDTAGKLNDVKILRGLGSGLDEEVIKVLENSPKWKPGIQNGRAVRVQYTLPVSVSPPGQKTGAINHRSDPEPTYVKTTESKTAGSRSREATFSASDSIIRTKDGDMILKGKNVTVIGAANYPGLVIVNGTEYPKASLERLEPNRIESMNVLKGESALRKYGDRGKEGAIEITLKKK